MPLWVPVVIGAASCVAALLGYLASPTAQDRAVRHLPTPASSLPLVGNTLDLMLRQRRRIYDWLAEQSRVHQGRPWRVRVLGRPPGVVLSCPEAFEDVLKTQFERFEKGDMITAIVSDVLGQGIFGVDGALWMHQRKTASNLFTVRTIRDVMQPIVRERCDALIGKLRECAAAGEPVDVKRLLDYFTMDVFAKIGFGVDLRGVEGDGDSEFLDAFERCSRRVVERFQQPALVWKLLRWLNIGREHQHAKDMQMLNGFAFEVISRSMKEKTQRVESDDEPKRCPRDLISLFLDRADAVYSDGQHAPTDPRLLRDMSMNMLFAGRDTTSLSMAWFLLMMNQFPAVLDRIRAELTEKLPGLSSDGAPVPTFDDVQHLVYLEAAIRESLRLNPVVAVTTRVTKQDTTLYDGTFIREGTRVVLPHYAMARMPNVWGDDAELFNPSRWIDADTGKLLHVSPFKFSVFLAGPRMCLGMTFALVEMKITLAAMLSKFDFTTVRDPFAFSYRPSMTLQIDGPLEVVVTPIRH